MNNKQTYKLSTNALFQDVDDEMVILDTDTGQYYTLNPVGAFIIDALNKGLNIDELLQLGLQTYNVQASELENDSIELIDKMIEKGLLEQV